MILNLNLNGNLLQKKRNQNGDLMRRDVEKKIVEYQSQEMV